MEECFSAQHNTKQHSDQELQIISTSARFVTRFHDITTSRPFCFESLMVALLIKRMLVDACPQN